MCLKVERHCGPGMTAESAGSFASAAVIANVAMSEWQVSQDAEEAMASAVTTLGQPVERLVVVLHRDWVDVYATGDGSCVARRCISRRSLGPFECQEEPQGLSSILDDVIRCGPGPST